MNIIKNLQIKNACEIGAMAGALTVRNQRYVLNTINALLFAQSNEEDISSDKPNPQKTA